MTILSSYGGAGPTILGVIWAEGSVATLLIALRVIGKWFTKRDHPTTGVRHYTGICGHGYVPASIRYQLSLIAYAVSGHD